MNAPNSTPLAGDWVHSHEEDQGDTLVFRPASFRFPPSRPRWRFDLQGDYTATETPPGPVDQPIVRSRPWSVNSQRQLVLGPQTPGGESTVMDIISAAPDRLVLRRPVR